VEWALLLTPGTIWGASFFFIAEGLEAMAPNGVTFTRIAIGFLTLSLLPAARRPIARDDRLKTALLGVLWLAFPLSMFPFAEQHVSSALTGMLTGAAVSRSHPHHRAHRRFHGRRGDGRAGDW
jgi:drug/metabolite transporter (DMT)-like permease